MTKKQKKNNKILYVSLLALTICVLIFSIITIQNTKKERDYYEQELESTRDSLSLSFEEKDNPTNCDINRLPNYLTADDVSKTEESGDAFFIMLIYTEEWDCEPRDDYGVDKYWCDCSYIG